VARHDAATVDRPAPSGALPGRREAARPSPVTLIRLAGEIARSLAGVAVWWSKESAPAHPVQGGWVYFSLRDRAAELKVVLPRAKVRHSRVVAASAWP